jgi:hypothetical protein
MLKKYLLSSVAFRPEDEAGAGGTPEDERIPVDLTDDEDAGDPVDEPSDEAEDDAPDDDGADELDSEARERQDRERAAQPSRRERQVSELRRARQELAEQNATLTRQLEELRRNPPQPQQYEDPRAEAERLALMSPEDRIQYTVDKSLQRHAQQQQIITNQLLDQSDRAAFEARAVNNPIAKKLAPEVERRLGELRSRGQNLPRDVVLTYIVGEKALAQMGKGKDKTAVRERQRQQQARPANGRGDTSGDRRARRSGDSDVAALERRLENVPI